MKLGAQLPILVFCALTVGIIGFRYYDYLVRRNFMIEVNTVCNPTVEKCFVSDCTPDNDLSCPPGPYKKILIRDSDAPKCLEEHNCTDFVCGAIASCVTTYCSTDVVKEGESCQSMDNSSR